MANKNIVVLMGGKSSEHDVSLVSAKTVIENIEWVEVSEEETIDLDELEDMFPDDFCGV